MCDYANNITAERIKRVIKGYGEGDKAVEGTGGDFSYYELGPRLLMDDGMLNEDAPEEKIREYIYYSEVRKPLERAEGKDRYLLGVAYDVAYYFCYEKGCLTKLDRAMLSSLKTKAQSYVIYAESEPGDMNPDERQLANDFAACGGVEWWHRIKERGEGEFRLGGKCEGAFNHYPDFIVKMKSGKILLVESKGDDRDNSDSRAKLELGIRWAAQAGEMYRYFMVFSNQEMDGALKRTEFNLLLPSL